MKSAEQNGTWTSALAIMSRRLLQENHGLGPSNSLLSCRKIIKSYAKRFMDEQFEDGNAFAIPALWEPLAQFDECAKDSNAFRFEFEPLGTSLKVMMKMDWTLILCDRSAQ